MIKIAVIIGSTRPNRNGEAVARNPEKDILETPRWSSLIINLHKFPHAKLMRAIELLGTRVAPLVRTELASGTAEAPLDETRVEFDEDKIDQTVNDVRDHAHLNARRQTQDKYE